MTTHHHEETTMMRVPPSPDATTPTDRTPEPVREPLVPRATMDDLIQRFGMVKPDDHGEPIGCSPESTPEPATGATVDALEFNRFLAERLKDPAVRAAYVQSKTRTDSDYDIARHALSDLRTDAGFVLGDVIARLVLDSGAVVATARADAGWAKVKTLAEDFVREFERAEDAEDALARVTRENEALRAQVAAVEALATKFEGWPSGPSYAVTAKAIRAALAAPDGVTPTGDEVGAEDGVVDLLGNLAASIERARQHRLATTGEEGK